MTSTGIGSPKQKFDPEDRDTNQSRQCRGCGYVLAKGECHQCERDGVLYIVYDGCVGGLEPSQKLHVSTEAAGDVGILDPFNSQPLHIAGEVLRTDSTRNTDWHTLLGCNNKGSKDD